MCAIVESLVGMEMGMGDDKAYTLVPKCRKDDQILGLGGRSASSILWEFQLQQRHHTPTAKNGDFFSYHIPIW